MASKDVLKELVVEIRTDQRKLKSEMNEIRGDMKKQGEKLGSSFKSGFATMIKGIGATVILHSVINAVKKSIDLYAKQEAAEKRLSVAYGKNIKNLTEYASALQQKTAYGDEDIIEAQALIAAFVKEEDAIKRATKATLDLAAAKGMDLKVAADLLSKTLGSSTNALSRYGIEVNGAVGSAERLDSAMESLNEKFGGQAEAQLETYTGKVKALSNAWGDMLEVVGKGSIKYLFAGVQTILGGGNFGANLASNELNEQLAQAAREVEQEFKNNVPKAIEKTIITINSLEKEITDLQDQLKETSIDDFASRDKLQNLIKAKKEIIDNFLNPIKKEIYHTFGSIDIQGLMMANDGRSFSSFVSSKKSYSTTPKRPAVDMYGYNYINESLSDQKDLWVDIQQAQSVAMGSLASQWASQINLIKNANSMLEQFLNTLVQVGLQQIAISAIGSFGGGGILGTIGSLFSGGSGLDKVVGAIQANTAVLEGKNMSPSVNVSLDGISTVKSLEKKKQYLSKSGRDL